MSNIIVKRGRHVGLSLWFATGDYTAPVQALSVDDNSNGFQDTDLALNRAGALTIANFFVVNFDATPVLDAINDEVTATATIPAVSGNFTQRRSGEHNVAAASVTASSNTLCMGVDGLALTKNNGVEFIYEKITLLVDGS